MRDRLRRWWSNEADLGAIAWLAAVVVVYTLATLGEAFHRVPETDRMMNIAANVWQGRFDAGPVIHLYDIVQIDGRNYLALGLGPLLPYLLFVPFKFLWLNSKWIADCAIGILAAAMALPVARRYGPQGSAQYWLAALGGFGTLVLTQATVGNTYFMAQCESVACTFLVLWEWAGRRRPWLLGLGFGLASLAREDVLLAGIPFAIWLIRDSQSRAEAAGKAIRFASPILVCLVLTGLFNFVRFGDVFDTGYARSIVPHFLAVRRAQGLFSMVHVPDNLNLLFLGGFGWRATPPFLVANANGQSILLTSPGLVIALRAGIRDPTSQLLWISTAIVAVPVLLYYGLGGPSTYGYRYALDFVPFLFALSAMGARKRFGSIEKILIVFSILFVGYGLVWNRFR